jgi:hypothetical protein
MVTLRMATSMATFGQLGVVDRCGEPVLTRCFTGGSRGTRTPGPLLVRQVL